jgi:hypothetical protein
LLSSVPTITGRKFSSFSYTLFFIEHSEELSIIILSREKRSKEDHVQGDKYRNTQRKQKKRLYRKRKEASGALKNRVTPQTETTTTPRETAKTSPNQGHNLLRALAPANSQSLASSWICCITELVFGETP